MNTKRSKYLFMLLFAVILTAAILIPVQAAQIPVPDSQTNPDPEVNVGTPEEGKTLVGVAVSKTNPENLSVEVPLYVTLSVTKDSTGTPVVYTPDGYSITNNTKDIDKNVSKVGITGMTVSGVANGTWSLSENAPTSNAKTMQFTIAGLVMPTVQAGSTAAQTVNLKVVNSPFYDNVTSKFKPIDATGTGQALNLEGKVSSTYQITDSSTIPQFKIKYRISLLDEAGNPIGVQSTDN